MVVFTCNNCGDSVKKPKVDKHVSVECKRKRSGNVSLCCIDCLKDFDAHSYNGHTKCVTEEERYSAPGFVPKASSNKGERKQNSWLDAVRSALNNSNLSKPQRLLLMTLSNYENVPRKKSKFLNFIKNSANFRSTSYQVVEEVYDLMEAEFKTASVGEVSKNVNSSNMETITKDDAKSLEIPNKSEENVTNQNNAVPTESNEVSSEKSKKKRKRKNEDDSLQTDVGNDSVEEKLLHNDDKTSQNQDESFVVVEKKKKKQKDKKNKDNVAEADPVQSCQPSDVELVQVSEKNNTVNSNGASNNDSIEDEDAMYLKKDGRKKRKDKNMRSEDNSINEMTDASVTETSEHKVCETNGILTGQENSGDVSRKKKKRKLEEAQIENDINSKRSRIEEIENCEVESNPKRFSWEEVVKTLLEKSKDGEMSVKKMTKKVVAEYQSVHANNKSFEEIAKKFNKKVKRLPFVVVLKDRIQLYVQ